MAKTEEKIQTSQTKNKEFSTLQADHNKKHAEKVRLLFKRIAILFLFCYTQQKIIQGKNDEK